MTAALFRRNLSLLVALMWLTAIAFFLAPYLISVLNNHVYPGFPTIRFVCWLVAIVANRFAYQFYRVTGS